MEAEYLRLTLAGWTAMDCFDCLWGLLDFEVLLVDLQNSRLRKIPLWSFLKEAD